MDAGQVKDATPLFVCAGMFGNILNLRHFAREVGIDRPVYGLQARGLYGDHEPHTSFADMARDYLAEIREIQPEGPYLLAGYSGGGITAFEIAQQLLAQGEQVGHVVMLDTAFPQQPPLILRDRMLMKAQDLWRYKHAFLSEWLREKKRWKAEISAKRRALEQPDRAPDGFNNYAIEAAYRQAAQTYQARPFPGKITLLRATPTAHYRISQGRLLQKNRNIILNDNGWQDYVAELLILQVPGDHDSMMLDPYVKVVGRYARSALLEAEKNWRDIALPGATDPQEPKLAATRQAETA
jgi:thioesterase domain-containing protein